MYEDPVDQKAKSTALPVLPKQTSTPATSPNASLGLHNENSGYVLAGEKPPSNFMQRIKPILSKFNSHLTIMSMSLWGMVRRFRRNPKSHVIAMDILVGITFLRRPKFTRENIHCHRGEERVQITQCIKMLSSNCD